MKSDYVPNEKYAKLLGEAKDGYDKRRTDAYIERLEKLCTEASDTINSLKAELVKAQQAASENSGASNAEVMEKLSQLEEEKSALANDNAALLQEVEDLKQKAGSEIPNQDNPEYSKEFIAQVLIDARVTADQIISQAKQEADSEISAAQRRVGELKLLEDEAREKLAKIYRDLEVFVRPGQNNN